jgi:hypothetical protein
MKKALNKIPKYHTCTYQRSGGADVRGRKRLCGHGPIDPPARLDEELGSFSRSWKGLHMYTNCACDRDQKYDIDI